MIEQQIKCRRRSCGDQLTIPVKLVIKGNRVIDVARCPRCHKSYKFILSLEDKDQWMPIMTKNFFLCDVCGASNDDNWHEYQTGLSQYTKRVKIFWKCKKCRRKRAKVASEELWIDLTKQFVKHSGVPPTSTLQCPHCGVEIPQNTKVCPNCKIELLCSKCGALIKPRANFCMNCGNSVEKVEVSTSNELVKEHICPTCEEKYETGSLFCSVCGQELICDKCGAEIREGALFCVNCGDVVTKGELSE